MPPTVRRPSRTASRRIRWPHDDDKIPTATKPWPSLGLAIALATGPRGFTTLAELARASGVTPRVLLAFAAGECASPADLPAVVKDTFDPANAFVPKDRRIEFELATEAIMAEWFERLDDPWFKHRFDLDQELAAPGILRASGRSITDGAAPSDAGKTKPRERP